jgi:hypothetical protein
LTGSTTRVGGGGAWPSSTRAPAIPVAPAQPARPDRGRTRRPRRARRPPRRRRILRRASRWLRRDPDRDKAPGHVARSTLYVVRPLLRQRPPTRQTAPSDSEHSTAHLSSPSSAPRIRPGRRPVATST